jgi:hypothetical protein
MSPLSLPDFNKHFKAPMNFIKIIQYQIYESIQLSSSCILKLDGMTDREKLIGIYRIAKAPKTFTWIEF